MLMDVRGAALKIKVELWSGAGIRKKHRVVLRSVGVFAHSLFFSFHQNLRTNYPDLTVKWWPTLFPTRWALERSIFQNSSRDPERWSLTTNSSNKKKAKCLLPPAKHPCSCCGLQLLFDEPDRTGHVEKVLANILLLDPDN